MALELNNPGRLIAQSAGAVEYTDCISVEGQDSPNECSGYGTKQSDEEVPVMLEPWGMQGTPILPSLLGPLWPGVIAPHRVLYIGKKLNKVPKLDRVV